MRRGCLARTSRADVQSQRRVLSGETESTGAAGEGSKARRMEKSLLFEWVMWLGDAEGRDRAGSDAGFKGIVRIHFAPDCAKEDESILIYWFLDWLCQCSCGGGIANTCNGVAKATLPPFVSVQKAGRLCVGQ